MIYDTLGIKKPSLITPEERKRIIREEVIASHGERSTNARTIEKYIKEFDNGRNVDNFPSAYEPNDELLPITVNVAQFRVALRKIKSKLPQTKRRLGWSETQSYQKLRWVQLTFNSHHQLLFVCKKDGGLCESVDIKGCKNTFTVVVWLETLTLSNTNPGILDVLYDDGVENVDVYAEVDNLTDSGDAILIKEGNFWYKVRVLHDNDLYKEEVIGL